jgi:hypothetical protein
MENKLEIIAECETCNGTGLYIGLAERNGLAVVCNHCNGEGYRKIEYKWKTFKEKKIIPNIKKVIKKNSGFVLTPELTSGGLKYVDWLAGNEFKKGTETREFVCPKWWDQSISEKLIQMECALPGTSFKACKHFKDKNMCWENYDKNTMEKIK